MNVQTSIFARGVFSLVLGYVGLIVAEWFVLGPTSLEGQPKLLIFGVLFAVFSTVSFAAITFSEDWARERGLPVSSGITGLYRLATVGLLFGAGATVAYWTVQQVPSYRALALPITAATGMSVAIVGGYLLYGSDGHHGTPR